ncbi:tRNA:m(4)X modification enzyme TRM13 [Euphorbia peplus]|nr:tRNA:m(4)X modification enzyme TRM13 [Euphorbia peplus]
MESSRCKFYLSKKNRFCANIPLNNSPFCGNHIPRSDGEWLPCPIDPSHSVLRENLDWHVKRCPLLKQRESLSIQPFYLKGVNAGKEGDDDDDVTSEMKRKAVYSMSVAEFCRLVRKIESVHGSVCKDIVESYRVPEACNMWIKREVDRKIPFQEKHVKQQASILGNLEDFGVLKGSLGKERGDDDRLHDDNAPAVVEFGAGRGYLTQMLADCYGIEKVFLVERKSYKLKADRSLRQKESLVLERLRIDIEDLNLNAVESLQGVPYLAIGKHLCGPATDLTLRCCLPEQCSEQNTEHCNGSDSLRGLAIAMCCHHLCQWKHYINKNFFADLGITKEQFHAITWFTSWAVDADHSSDLSFDCGPHQPQSLGKEQLNENANGIEDVVRNMKPIERAVLGFMCKQIIDMGRMKWVKGRGLETELIKYVPSNISPENHLLIAKTRQVLVK